MFNFANTKSSKLVKTIAKILLLLESTILVGIISPVALVADGDDEIIVTKPKGGGDDNNGGDRSLGIIPMQASHNGFSHLVSVDFVSNVGQVNIGIENEDTGSVSSYVETASFRTIHSSFLARLVSGASLLRSLMEQNFLASGISGIISNI